MATESKNIRLSANTFRQLQEVAAQKGKLLDDVADEMLQSSMRSETVKLLMEDADYGARQAEKLYPGGLTEDDVADIVHRRRQMKRAGR